MFLQSLEHLSNVSQVSTVVVGVNQDIVNVNDETLIEEILENFIHERLENCWHPNRVFEHIVFDCVKYS